MNKEHWRNFIMSVVCLCLFCLIAVNIFYLSHYIIIGDELNIFKRTFVTVALAIGILSCFAYFIFGIIISKEDK